jgi:hypothetical protein
MKKDRLASSIPVEEFSSEGEFSGQKHFGPGGIE